MHQVRIADCALLIMDFNLDSFVRKGKIVSVDESSYRLYVHLVSDLYYLKAAVLWHKMMMKRGLHKIRRLTGKEEQHV